MIIDKMWNIDSPDKFRLPETKYKKLPLRFTLVTSKHLADFVKIINATVLYLALPDHPQDFQILQKIHA
jgi:hypothetical protein